MNNKQKIIITVIVLILIVVGYFLVTKNTILKYNNTDLGISFNYPEKVNDKEIKVFSIHDVVFVTSEDSLIYKNKNTLEKNNDSQSLVLESYKIKKLDSSNGVGSWIIYTGTFDQNSSEDTLIDFWFNKKNNLNECSVIDKKLTNGKDLYDYSVGSINSKVADQEDINCLVDWRN